MLELGEFRRVYILLERWDDFRTTNWLDIIEYPEITLQQTQQLLSLYLA